jgi:hypothetical protein
MTPREGLLRRRATPQRGRPRICASRCWGWAFDAAELDAAAALVRGSASECFGDRSFDVIGFSNGGYLVNQLLRTCSLRTRLPRASRLITVGAAAPLQGTLEAKPVSLEGCGDLTMLVGREDEHNSDPASSLLHALEVKRASVRETRFDGGHLLRGAPLESVLFAKTP